MGFNKHAAMWLLVGWLVSLFISPSHLMGAFKAKKTS